MNVFFSVEAVAVTSIPRRGGFPFMLGRIVLAGLLVGSFTPAVWAQRRRRRSPIRSA